MVVEDPEEMVVGEDEERIKVDNRHRIARMAIKNPCFMFFQFVSRVACGYLFFLLPLIPKTIHFPFLEEGQARPLSSLAPS